jgi:hypothetical protein
LLLGLLDAVRVPRPGGVGRPRVRPDYLVADKAYSSRVNRVGLRARRIPDTIPSATTSVPIAVGVAARGAGRWVCRDQYRRRNKVEIVCTQVTKPGLGAAGGGWDHIADLHLAVGHHDPVDQQLDQLAALLEAGLVQTSA